MFTDLQIARETSALDTAPLRSILRTSEEWALRDKILPILSKDPLFSKAVRYMLLYRNLLPRLLTMLE
jgi:hypothetical protein